MPSALKQERVGGQSDEARLPFDGMQQALCCRRGLVTGRWGISQAIGGNRGIPGMGEGSAVLPVEIPDAALHTQGSKALAGFRLYPRGLEVRINRLPFRP